MKTQFDIHMDKLYDMVVSDPVEHLHGIYICAGYIQGQLSQCERYSTDEVTELRKRLPVLMAIYEEQKTKETWPWKNNLQR